MAIGLQIRDARLSRNLSLAELAARAGVSRSLAYLVEAGQPTSVEAVTRLAYALGRRLELLLADPRRQAGQRPNLSVDIVHSAMAEMEQRQLRPRADGMRLDEPYQHYQFAGRADLVAWRSDPADLLHIENRTRFPDFQEMAGAFNSKRAYLGAAIAERAGVRRWHSETHVIAALWSAEVLHALRQRSESFRTLCPDDSTAFAAWWSGDAAPPRGQHSALIVLDPLAAGRQRPFIGLDKAINSARPRYRGYADAAERLSRIASGPLSA